MCNLACFSPSTDGLGERMCGYRDADTPVRERSQAVLPLLARRGLEPLSHLRGACTQPLTAPPDSPCCCF